MVKEVICNHKSGSLLYQAKANPCRISNEIVLVSRKHSPYQVGGKIGR
jgi:hypothetical protein